MLTLAVVVALVLVFAMQSLVGIPESVAAAGLIKPLNLASDWWRLGTATALHGNLLHIVANCTVLWTFGNTLEERAGWRTLAFVYSVSGIMGSLASVWLLDATSIGASGAVLGVVACAGLVDYRDPADERASIAVAAGRTLALTALLGGVLHRVVDNAAHAGGVLAGVLAGFLLTRGPVSLPLATAALAVIVAGTSLAGVRVFRAAPAAASRVSQVADHVDVQEARVTLRVSPGLEGVEYAITNIGTRPLTAWEVGFYADDGIRRVGSIVGDTCRPVEGVAGWLRPGQTFGGGFRSIRGTSRRGLTARADVVLIDGAGFSGSPARYQAMLDGRAHRLEELRATAESLLQAMEMPDEEADRFLTARIDERARAAEERRQPLLISPLLAARRNAGQKHGRWRESAGSAAEAAGNAAETLARCDVR